MNIIYFYHELIDVDFEFLSSCSIIGVSDMTSETSFKASTNAFQFNLFFY